MMNKAGCLILVLALGGCRERPPPSIPDPVPASASAGTNEVGKVQVITPAEAASLKLMLDSEGLRLFNTVAGSSRLIPYGSARDEVIQAVSLVRHAQPLEQGDVDECEASYVRWDGGLSAWFVNDRLSGWSVAAGRATLATARGIRPGSTRAELEAAYGAKVMESSLGLEFTAGGFAGILGPDGRVASLWSGATCLPR